MIETIFLIIITLVQSALFPFDILFLILIIRSLVIPGKGNYYLGFFLGLLASVLTNSPLGWVSLCYLLTIKIASIISAQALKTHFLWCLPLSFLLVIFNSLLNKFLSGTSFSYGNIIYQMAFVLPIYFLYILLEDRLVSNNSNINKLSLKR